MFNDRSPVKLVPYSLVVWANGVNNYLQVFLKDFIAKEFERQESKTDYKVFRYSDDMVILSESKEMCEETWRLLTQKTRVDRDGDQLKLANEKLWEAEVTRVLLWLWSPVSILVAMSTSRPRHFFHLLIMSCRHPATHKISNCNRICTQIFFAPQSKDEKTHKFWNELQLKCKSLFDYVFDWFFKMYVYCQEMPMQACCWVKLSRWFGLKY